MEAGTALQFVEGPQKYSSADVAAVLSGVFNKTVKAVETPAAQWVGTLQKNGFSAAAAQSMAAMTQLTLNGIADALHPYRGKTGLSNYFSINFS